MNETRRFGTCLAIAIAVAAGATTPAAELRESIDGFLQTRPGGPREQVTARVEPAPPTLEIVRADEAGLDASDLVIGVVVEGEARAYPIRQLSSHEVVNDTLAGVPVVATWCPLTGTGITYRREADGRELTFDFVWGLVHDNLVMTDRETGSVWSQLLGEALSGSLESRSLTQLPSIQSTWEFWHERHPDTDVVLVPGSAGRPYRYFDPADGGRPGGPASGEHDLSALGLGIVVDDVPVFFPMSAVAAEPGPLRMSVIGKFTVVHHDAEGMTMWAEGADGQMLPGRVSYEPAWRAFHPGTRAFEPDGACSGAPPSGAQP